MVSEAIGFVACFVASLFFGTAYVPVKNYDTGDVVGVFVQWVMGCAIFCVGLVIQIVQHFPKFYPLPMLGGLCWAIGNVTAVPIINCIGLAIGMLIWSTSNLMVGWASGRFGLFGLTPEVPESSVLNYLGLVISMASGVIFVLVKSSPAKRGQPSTVEDNAAEGSDEDDPLIIDREHGQSFNSTTDPPKEWQSPDDFLAFLTKGQRRIVGVVLSVLAGCFYGVTFDPVIYITDHSNQTDSMYYGASSNGLDYVFSHYTGIFISSTVVMILYSAYKQNRPHIVPQVFLPAFTAGIMWAIAQTSWFLANQSLSEAISFPIIARGPCIVATMWGVLYFREIEGKRNLIILVVAIGVSILGVILTGLSKSIKL